MIGMKSIEIGDIINNRYQILEARSGGFSTVYHSYDRILERMVALKVSNSSSRDKFRLIKEANLLSKYSHPNVITCLDYFKKAINGRDQEILVLEFSKLGTLRDFIRGKSELLYSELDLILLDILNGLEHIHFSGVIHRDLKPENILLFKIESSGKTIAKISDFLISYSSSTQISDSNQDQNIINLLSNVSFPIASRIAGTPLYMAPEQFDAGSPIGPMTDFWAFGIMLYEILVGKNPFLGESIDQTRDNVFNLALDLSKVPRKYKEIIELCNEKKFFERVNNSELIRNIINSEIVSGGIALNDYSAIPTIVSFQSIYVDAILDSVKGSIYDSIIGGFLFEDKNKKKKTPYFDQKEVLELFKSDKINDCFIYIERIFQSFDNLKKKEFSSLKMQWNNYKHQSRLGILSFEQKNILANTIKSLLYDFIEEI